MEEEYKRIKGYKVFNKDWTCLGKQYSCPGVFEEDVAPSLCEQGMHFCTLLKDCFFFYPLNPLIHVAEVVANGRVDTTSCISGAGDSKHCTDKLEIVKELSFDEILEQYFIESIEDIFEPPYSTGDLYKFTSLHSLFIETGTHKNNFIEFINLINNYIPEEISYNRIATLGAVLDLAPQWNRCYVRFKGRKSGEFFPPMAVEIDLGFIISLFDDLNIPMEDIARSYTHEAEKQSLHKFISY